MNRRTFLQLLAGAAAASPFSSGRASSDSLGAVLPRRPLGASGPQVTCLGLGGYHIGWTTEDLARATIEAALEEGVRFFDTAESYGPHISEERYGRYLTPRYRDEIFLMTKSQAKTAAAARRAIEDSLRRLATDRVDLWQFHSLETPEDVDARLAGGVLEEALKAQAEGKIASIGFTGHASPYAHLRLLERTGGDSSPFLTCQFPVNPVDAASPHSFITRVLPEAQKSGLGCIAMKTLADGRFFARKQVGERTVWESANPVVPGAVSLSDCIHFALSLPIATLVTGAENPAFLREKAVLTRSFHQMDETARRAVIDRVAGYAREGKVEYYKARALREPDPASAG